MKKQQDLSQGLKCSLQTNTQTHVLMLLHLLTGYSLASAASDYSTSWLTQNTSLKTSNIFPWDQTPRNFVKPFDLWSSHKTWKPSVQETQGEHWRYPLWQKTQEDLQGNPAQPALWYEQPRALKPLWKRNLRLSSYGHVESTEIYCR